MNGSTVFTTTYGRILPTPNILNGLAILLSAIIECADAAHGLGGRICADGGCTVPGDIAKRTFDIVLSKVDNPKGRWNKAVPGSRALKSFALPMILGCPYQYW